MTVLTSVSIFSVTVSVCVCLHSVGSLLSIRLPPPSCLVEALTAIVENVFQKIRAREKPFKL